MWALVIGILAPVVNNFTPLLDADYNNAWTPDVFWRLVLYFHGAFIPWMMALAALALLVLRLRDIEGKIWQTFEAHDSNRGFLLGTSSGCRRYF